MDLHDYLIREDLPLGRACAEARRWRGDLDAATTVAECPRGEWLLWLATRLGYDATVLSAAVRPAVLRAAREGAADACEEAGLVAEASALRALRDDASFFEIESTARAAAWSVKAAWAATEASSWAASWSWTIPGAAMRAARAAGAAAAGEVAATEERRLCADEVRAALPDLTARLLKALED